ncbi:MAG TPA: tetratricopeptide repeat protein [Thermoanaerobaculia bacterium]|jgi:tetratricopeptide (TPR) repeat protein|nr:tetratricopeptide repeat protein [Thermoanaerobaculia bacterium]
MALQREQVVQTAEKYVSRGKIEPAIREYRKLLTENPNDINTLNRVGDLYARIQRIDEAVDFFTQIAEQYTTEGFFVKAIAIYKKIIKLDPTRLEVYEKLAELYHKQGLVNEARTQYQVLADYYQKHDNAASAIAIYQKMADLEPNNPSYHVKLAEIYQQQQLIEKAVGEYRVIAEMMIAHGRSQDAAQVYERALDIDSSNVGFINDAVFRLKESGNAAAAARFLSIASERNPQASRIARLAQVEAVEETAPASAPAPAPADLEVEAEPEPAYVVDEGYEEEESYGTDLAAMMAAAEAAVASPGPAASAPEAEPESEEFELDLDEAFVLDMEDDNEPASLVKPPPDMAGEGLRLGTAWAPEGTGAGVSAAPAPAAPVEEPLAQEDFPEIEIELEPDLELAPPAAAVPDSFGSLEMPRLDMSGEIYLEVEEPDLPSLDSASWTVGPAAAEPQPGEPGEIDADFLEHTAASLHPAEMARDEDLVSEAEVLAKYGLEEKALERLSEALRIQPRNLAAYGQMIQIHLGQGRHDRVVELANAMARAAGEVRDAQAWPRMRKELLSAGYRLDGDRVVAGPQGFAEETVEIEPLKAVDVLEDPERLEDLATIEAPALEEPPPAAPPAVEPPPVAPPPPVAVTPIPEPAPPPAPAARKRPASRDIDQLLRGLLDDKPKRPAAPRPAPPPPAQTPPTASAASSVEPPTPAPSPARPGMFNPLEIGEMIEQEEDFDWVPSAGGSAPLPPLPAPPPASNVSFAPSLDDTGSGSWLDEADHNRPVKSPASESLFDEEDDFFDLAAQLEQELSQEDLFPAGEHLLVQPAEQSLEEIVEGFKKGVAEHLSPTDYDTHFNLGIAYREMGLLDEAIGEFQIAAKDPRHLVLCCSMLGLCFLDKGLPELAVKWYHRGLEAPGLSEEDNLGLLYDLGCAYLTLDDKASAYKTFVDLYGINNAYRDVVARIEELGR